MASAAKPRKKFRVAVSGMTIDGREISGQHLKEAAENYNPSVYKAPINMEHYLSPFPDSEFSAMGEVISMSAEDITDGPLAGRVALYAEIEPSERMKKLTDEGKKVHSSIELYPRFALNGKAYVAGIAMTDKPASLGTERLKFTAEQRAQVMRFNNQQGDAPLLSDAIEAELVELSEQRSEEGAQWFTRVMGLIGKGRKSDSEQFSQVRDAVENVAQSHADLLDSFNDLSRAREQDSQTIQKLTTDLAALTSKLGSTDGDFSQRPSASGSENAQLADY
ncbi:TPA: GPO family capsid scaffolding protein [Klebsiella aerogenes]|uniref:GPO family capsid scaffolding protein n=1 Tax=Klebsiella aerogenes TaxID=548 RepID=UPI00292C73A6|nr:GPO family capsid scaffolding protein [Klebsiella aerogenes]HEC1355686.1 GPO family capsid scaffolding protein [Klebsiella aerogenes]